MTRAPARGYRVLIGMGDTATAGLPRKRPGRGYGAHIHAAAETTCRQRPPCRLILEMAASHRGRAA